MQVDLNHHSIISEDIKDKIYNKFLELPLREKLVVYAKIVNKDSFRAQDHDLFGLNRRLVSKIYKNFINELREELCENHSK